MPVQTGFDATLTIQPTPKRSVSMPKRGDQNVLASGIRTWPPAASAAKARSASASVGTWKMIRLKYRDGCEIILEAEDASKKGAAGETAFIQGPQGKIMKGFKSDIPDFDKKLAQLKDPEPQITDFVQAVKTRQKFALNERNGHRSCTLVNIAKTALQTGRRLRFDPKKQRFIDDADANRYILQPYRGPWKLT